MAKNVLRAYEVQNKNGEIVSIKAPAQFLPPEPEEALPAESYMGPTADDLRREADEFKERWDAERAMMIQEAELQKEEILKKAEEAAFEVIKKEKENAVAIRIQGEKDAQALVDKAKTDAEKLQMEATLKIAEIENEARKKGYDAGYTEGYAAGQGEVERLTQRIHVIMDKIVQKRQDIIDGTETQIVQLVLMIAKKVVKVISENQRNVVINNVLQALRKLKTRGDVVVRVNLEDLKITSEHVKEFLKLVENVKSITVMEDSTVDMGGCVIETDFGEIDARVSSQFNEIEEKILEMTPIQSKTSSETANPTSLG